MRITFHTQETDKQENIRNGQQSAVERRERSNRRDTTGALNGAVCWSGKEDGWMQGALNKQGNREKPKTLTELQQEAGYIDVGNRQDYMTLMSNTMSEEDYAKLEEEGFHFASMDPETAVTIVDKIKAELARSGQYIAGYTDDLDMATLAAAVGSDTLARAITDSFQGADVPLTHDNVENVRRAWDMASQLEQPGDGASHYMIDNQAEPEILDFYVAQSSGAESMAGGVPRYYAEDIQGYYTQSAGGDYSTQSAAGAQDGLQRQIDKVIVEAGLELTEISRQNADWLLEKGLPLTAENLLRLQELQKVNFPVDEETFAKAAATAISNGKNPVHANLANTENIYDKAVRLMDDFWKKAEQLWDSGDVTARRQLEEIRLRMTAEANVKLLKSGFSIDTAPMEELLEALKDVEARLAESYFPQDVQAVEKYELYRQATGTVAELPSMPAQVVGSWSVREADGTLIQFHGEGKALQESYEKAQESYEALMTAPRSDMGDSIRKAFANVDAILEDLDYALNEQNRRAVRILGYNRMEMTVENIEKVKMTDEQVRSVISKMTPAATLKMIRDGVNPLDMSFEELENYFDSQPREYEESAESYSRFLYHLEQNKEISSSEREAYIGIHRLVHQIEKSDGAAIGAVVNTGAELQFANLLSAVRTGKFRHMDVKVTDETGFLKDLVREGKSISGQINDGLIAAAKEIMTEVSSDKGVEEQYNRMELERVRQAAEVQPEIYEVLERSGLAVNADNLFAAHALLKDGANPYKKWKEKAQELQRTDTVESVEEVLFDEDVSDFTESYQDALHEVMTNVEQATLEDAGSSVDVKELQLIHKQLSVMTAMSDSQEYILPMYIGDELGRVHLTLVRGAEQKGSVTIRMDWAENTHVEAHLQVDGAKVNGYLVGNTQEEVTKLQKTADIFHKLLKQDTSVNWETGEIPVVSKTAENHNADISAVRQENSTDTKDLYRVAGMFLQAMKE